METRFLPSSQITGRMYYTDVSIKLQCEKLAAARHHSVIGNQLLFANKRNRVRWVVLCLSQDGACTDSLENFRENSLKGDLSNDITLNPPLFSLVNTFKGQKCILHNLWKRCKQEVYNYYNNKLYKMWRTINALTLLHGLVLNIGPWSTNGWNISSFVIVIAKWY